MYCVSKMASLLPEEINLKILNSFLYSEIIECNTHCFSYYWNSKLDSLEAKGNHLACIFARNVALKGTNSNQTSVMVQAGIFLNDKLEKLDREIWKLTSGKEKQNRKVNNSWFDRKRKLWFVSNNNQVLPETLKFPILTTEWELNYWSYDRMIAFLDQYWWENINRAVKSAYFPYPTYPKYNTKKTIHAALGHFKLSDGPLSIWQMDFMQLPPFNRYKYV